MANNKKLISQAKGKKIRELRKCFLCEIFVIYNHRKLSTMASAFIKFFLCGPHQKHVQTILKQVF